MSVCTVLGQGLGPCSQASCHRFYRQRASLVAVVPIVYITNAAAAAAGKFGKWSRRDRESTQRIFFFKLFHYFFLGLKEQVFPL